MGDINKYKDIHKGGRGWIVCTGPSLDFVNSDFLRGEILIGMNRGYLKHDLDYRYFCAIDDLVIDQFGKEILSLPLDAVFTGNKLQGSNVVNLKWRGNEPYFQTDLTKKLWQGHTVTYVAMQVAYWMGFSEVYCIGLDHFTDYSNIKKVESGGHITVGKDPNHFSSGGEYFGEGVKWQNQDKRSVELAYMLARWYYYSNGRRLYNASVGSHLPDMIIPRKTFKGLYRTNVP